VLEILRVIANHFGYMIINIHVAFYEALLVSVL
jgi:hypothetical protein